jgi:hypothetical protein
MLRFRDGEMPLTLGHSVEARSRDTATASKSRWLQLSDAPRIDTVCCLFGPGQRFALNAA